MEYFWMHLLSLHTVVLLSTECGERVHISLVTWQLYTSISTMDLCRCVEKTNCDGDISSFRFEQRVWGSPVQSECPAGQSGGDEVSSSKRKS